MVYFPEIAGRNFSFATRMQILQSNLTTTHYHCRTWWNITATYEYIILLVKIN